MSGIYLDAAATTLQKPKSVHKAVSKAVRTLASPGRGGHKAAMRAADELYLCREKAAQLFNVPDITHIAFTSSATHAVNIAVRSLVRPGSRVLVSGFEHNAVTRTLRDLGAFVLYARGSLFEPETALFGIETRIDRADCVIINHVSNVFGYILPVDRIAEVCREAKVPLIIDASQSAGIIGIDAKSLDADFIAMPGHKGLYGPQGTGILICKDYAAPFITGGTGSESKLQTMPDFLPDKLEAGTHNMPGIAGLRRGIEYVLKRGTEEILEHEQTLIRIAEDGLNRLPRVYVYGCEHDFCRAGVLSFTVSDMDSEEVGQRLADADIAVRAGFHCAPNAHKSAGSYDTGTVRISVSDFNTEGEIEKFLRVMKKIVR